MYTHTHIHRHSYIICICMYVYVRRSNAEKRLYRRMAKDWVRSDLYMVNKHRGFVRHENSLNMYYFCYFLWLWWRKFVCRVRFDFRVSFFLIPKPINIHYILNVIRSLSFQFWKSEATCYLFVSVSRGGRLKEKIWYDEMLFCVVV